MNKKKIFKNTKKLSFCDSKLTKLIVIILTIIFYQQIFLPQIVKALTPGGLAYIEYYWPDPPSSYNGTQIGYFNFDVDLTIASSPREGAYFWAHQFKFISPGDGGYVGLQLVDNEKIAIFSIWQAVSATAGPGGYCVNFGGEGTGWSCRIPFDWKVGTSYKLRVWEECCAEEPSEDEIWIAAVFDNSTGEESIIGHITVPGSWPWLDSWSVAWVEYFGEVQDCNQTPYASAKFTYPFADNNTNLVPDSVHTSLGQKCSDGKITATTGGYILETGKKIEPPSAPNNPQGYRVNDSTVKIIWEEAIPGNFPISKYIVYRSTKNQYSSAVQIGEVVDLNNLFFDDNNSDFSITYYYWVKAFDNSMPIAYESSPSSMITINKTNIGFEKLPILLVHGFQPFPFSFDLFETWKPLVNKLTGNQLTGNLSQHNRIWSVDNDSWNIIEVEPSDNEHYDVFISDYTHFVNPLNPISRRLSTVSDIREYALNLSKEIQRIKEITGKSKIDIIAHSMGGLVARSYIECDDFKSTFAKKYIGNEFNITYYNDVRDLIMLGTPNHGTQTAKIESNDIICANQMVPNSYFLKVLNYNENITFPISNTIHIFPSDVINKTVNYISVTGIIPRNSYCDSQQPGVTPRGPNPNFKNECYINDKNALIKTIQKNADTSNLYDYSDGTVPANSVRIYGNSIKNYHVIHADHSHLRTYKKCLDLISDIIKHNQIEFTNYCDPFHQGTPFEIGFETSTLYKIGDMFCYSPITFQITDSIGRRTGNINGLINEIPGFFVNELDESIMFFNFDDPNLSYEILGRKKGFFGLSLFNNSDEQMNFFSSLNNPIAFNERIKYDVNWNLIKKGNIGFSVSKDNNNDGVFESSYMPPGIPIQFSSIQENDKVKIKWEQSKKGTYPIKAYHLYKKANNDLDFQFVTEISGTTNIYNDYNIKNREEYDYYLTAIDAENNESFSSSIAHVSPIIFDGQPNLELSIELNKHEFCYGDEVLYKVTVHNTGNGDATNTILTVTFPMEIAYASADKYRGEVQSKNVVTFNLGTIPIKSSKSFQIDAIVVVQTTYEKSAVTLFYVTCTEGSFDEKAVNITLKSCNGSNPISYIKLLLLNTKIDPDTGERYIEKDDELSMDVNIGGFTMPYTIEIQWGDGEKNILTNQNNSNLQIKHKYSSSGLMEIKIKVEDKYGKTKEVNTRIKVK